MTAASSGRPGWPKTYPDYARIRADFAVLDQNRRSGQRCDPELSVLPGMVVRSQVAGGGQTITMALISAREEPMNASLFGIPRDYKEVPRPKPLKTVIAQPAPQKASGSSTPKAPATATTTFHPKIARLVGGRLIFPDNLRFIGRVETTLCV